MSDKLMSGVKATMNMGPFDAFRDIKHKKKSKKKVGKLTAEIAGVKVGVF